MTKFIQEAVVEVTLADGQSLADADVDPPELASDRMDQIFTYVDDGDRGHPAAYDLSQYLLSEELDGWMLHDSVSNSTTRAWRDESIPERWRTDLTNVSGGEATFRLRTVGVERNF